VAFLYQSLNLAKRPLVQKNLRMGEASVFSFSNFGGAYIARWDPVGRDRKPVRGDASVSRTVPGAAPVQHYSRTEE
jgi:hypothetical protein